MKRDTFYFSHDFEPTSDPKIQAMLGDYGAIGYGLYWRLVEMLHSDSDHKLPLKKYLFTALAKQMSTRVEKVSAFIVACVKDYELFISDDQVFWSERVLRNIGTREEIIEKRRKAGRESARKRAENSTHVEHIPTNGNKGNERKGNEMKGKESNAGPDKNKVFELLRSATTRNITDTQIWEEAIKLIDHYSGEKITNLQSACTKWADGIFPATKKQVVI